MKLNRNSRSVAPRKVCPSCGKRGLGNIRLGRHTWESDVRDCRYCGEIVIVRSSKDKDNSVQKVSDHYA